MEGMFNLQITAFVLAVVVIVFGGFVVLYGLITRLCRQGSGLGRLMERYPAGDLPPGPTFAGRTVQIGAVRWKNCTTVAVAPQGLYLAVQPVFTKYRPVLIPWTEVKRIQQARLYWSQAMRFTVGEPPVANVTVPTDVYAAAYPYVAALFKQP